MSKKRDQELVEFIMNRLTGLEAEAKEAAGDNYPSYTVGAMSSIFDHVLSKLSDNRERYNTLSLINQPAPGGSGHLIL
ncbi:hypothetical protein [uncultured Dysgonomonas sp.]|uniref:hypothetical protein n=1 Tax=uncultured Dysgonomonas sp. TaxID=206096 RepID=UPI000AA302E0|nr:hypothetical protein [uncultured Dysgonomonas sp.]